MDNSSRNETHLTHAQYENVKNTSRREQISGITLTRFFLYLLYTYVRS